MRGEGGLRGWGGPNAQVRRNSPRCTLCLARAGAQHTPVHMHARIRSRTHARVWPDTSTNAQSQTQTQTRARTHTSHATPPLETRALDARISAFSPLADTPRPAAPASIPLLSLPSSATSSSLACGRSPSRPLTFSPLTSLLLTFSPTCSRPACESMRRPSCVKVGHA